MPRPYRRLVLQIIIFVSLVTSVTAAAGPGIEGRLTYLQAVDDKDIDVFHGSLRFVSRPGAAEFARLESLGVTFFDHGDGPVGSRTVYPARIPFAALEDLRGLDFLVNVDCAWRPKSTPPLPRSRPQIQTEPAWAVEPPGGGTLSGEGVVVCDIDTGVNYMHANFFRLSGETYTWLDVDDSGDLSFWDVVDLNGNGSSDGGESLAYIESGGTAAYGNTADVYDTGFDYLYNDADWNGTRESGAPGFGETDPCYGERLFVCDDLDGDGRLDPGEPLLALGPSCIRAIYNKDGSVHTRGVDLLQSEGDDWGHGTQVTNILGGGWAGHHEMTGVAPGVETLHVNYDFVDEPPYLIPIEAGLAWSIAEGADIVLIEDGEWVWEYLDGSSNLEIMINEYAADEGVVFIVPAGNLSAGHMHSRFLSTAAQSLIGHADYTLFWPSFVWTADVALGLTVTPPGQSPLALPLDGTTVVHDGYRIYSNVSVSPRGTHRIDLRLATDPEGGPIENAWAFAFTGPETEVHGFYGDDGFGWSSQAYWTAGEDPAYTVTWPATADSAISVAAYSPFDDGDIEPYSGWGPRVDGRADVDVCAPGSGVYSAAPWYDYDFWWFGGTSGAAPHVVGAAALLKELYPDLDNGLCRALLRAGAGQDEFTGDPDRAGDGKLRIHDAITVLLDRLTDVPVRDGLAMTVHPNPFNPATTVSLKLPGDGPARVRIFDAAGREVWDTRLAAAPAGWRRVSWRGVDSQGRDVPAGVYFAHVRQGGHVGACKLTLVK